MINLDFLFIYEIKLREIENLCLLKYELDKRGYRTKIVYAYDPANRMEGTPKYSTNVLCVPSCYTNRTLVLYALHFVRFQRVIDMQWENYGFEKDDKDVNSYFNYSGIGKDVVHISWGEINANRLLNIAHIDKSKIKVIGHVGMDFLRYPLSNYYMSREELFSKYKIPKDRRVLLYASSYYGDCYSDAFVEGMHNYFGDEWTECCKIMNESQETVLRWLEKICRERSDVFVIFRPHPGLPYRKADELAEKCSNFRVILDESIKQWILACDSVYMGNSTSVVETYFAKKECHLLFPLELPKGFEMTLQKNSNRISTYDSFAKSIDEDNTEFPVPSINIEKSYYTAPEIPSYVLFADIAEEIMHDDKYRLSRCQKIAYNEYSKKQLLERALIAIKPLYQLYIRMLADNRIQNSFFNTQKKIREANYAAIEDDISDEIVNDSELDAIERKITKSIEQTK